MKGCFLVLTICSTIWLNACTEQQIAQIPNVEISHEKAERNSQKNATQFISIARSDLFGSNIHQKELRTLEFFYQAFGDKNLIRKIIIQHFISEANKANLLLDFGGTETSSSVKIVYRQFLNRPPQEDELYAISRLIENEQLDTEMVYFAIMTSDEYLKF